MTLLDAIDAVVVKYDGRMSVAQAAKSPSQVLDVAFMRRQAIGQILWNAGLGAADAPPPDESREKS